MIERLLTMDDIDPEHRQMVTRQDYTPAKHIDGVTFVELKQFCDEGSSFLELGRLTDSGALLGIDGFHAQQVNFSELFPGAVKAWHIHFRQEDVWFVPPSARLLVGLYDVRAASPTHGQSMRFVLGAGKARLLRIPRGVAHGAANPWPTATLMLYFTNQHFSTDDADEQRLPWDLLGPDFWEVHKG